MNEFELLTPEGLATLLGVSRQWVREHVTAGDLPGQVTIGLGKLIRFRKSDVHAALLRRNFLETKPGKGPLPIDELEGDDLRQDDCGGGQIG